MILNVLNIIISYKQLKSMVLLEKRQRKYNPTHHFADDRLDCSANYLTDRAKGSKFLKKLWCCVSGAYYKIIGHLH